MAMENKPKDKRTPDYIAYAVTDVEGKQTPDGKQVSRWKAIGVAFSIRDGFNVLLDAVPVNGKVVLQIPKEFKEE
jgi:hypothetical protein